MRSYFSVYPLLALNLDSPEHVEGSKGPLLFISQL